MRFLIVGATGRTGRQVVEQALKRRHSIMAVVRTSSLQETADLRFVVANPCRVEDLLPALAGQDAVISCRGQRP